MYQNILLPHPNPPLYKGREPDFIVSLLYKEGLRGVIRLVVQAFELKLTIMGNRVPIQMRIAIT
ncbi:hypothetical protein A6769_05460 [Nostoc punctiforme NIES-2108]|uniref:Uncharacterized protein n=1 Tax=Nostoc punctiforme NIES-2108 TaxID=1356359 RepID=A0A367RVY3_NOSPU|nr:hypothetical protein A6769_05460 [Nostoc punctiforme NIES-2108]